MSFFQRLSRLFSPPARHSEAASYWVTVQCSRCGETIRARVDTRNDPSLNYDEAGKATYFCRKVLMGEGHCFQKVEVELTFDADHNLVERKIHGGTFIDE